MTRKEAIDIVMSATVWTDEEREALDILIPELRESEDEMIRKELLEEIEFIIPHDDETDSEGLILPSHRVRIDRYKSYLEKQKVLDKMIVVSPEVWDNAISDAFENGKKEGEKQKESPKSADSIPSDCTSDAKCGDRWQKVTDSLPDNGRLVLAQDCLGNTLLARYDGEGNWEVSVYDKDDYYCRNTITKWCDIPSENQKERKEETLRDFIDNFPYSDELKEQKTAEWSEEDEDIRQSIIKDIKWERANTPVTVDKDIRKYDKQIAWLKSLRPQPKKGLHPGSIRKVDNPMKWMEEDEKEREQKPVAWSEDDEKMINSIINVVCGVGSQPNGLREKQVYFLKSLRPSWKPSEEQIYSLGTIVKGYNECAVGSVGYHLKEMYEQLKRLM